MKAEELRIGNWIMSAGQVSQVQIINGIEKAFDQIYLEREEDFEWTELKLVDPIPLNEKWLLKFGFRKFSSTQFDRLDFWAIGYQETGSRKGEFYCNQLECYIKYVHQLQNLYYALTSSELTIKE